MCLPLIESHVFELLYKAACNLLSLPYLQAFVCHLFASEEAKIDAGCLAMTGSLWTSVQSSDHLFPPPTHQIPQRQNLPRFAHMVDVHSLKVSKLLKFDFHFNEKSKFAQRWKQDVWDSQISRSWDHLNILLLKWSSHF